MSFASLGIVNDLVDALSTQKISEPTPVQRLVVPPFLAGRSLIAVARTGSGKTFAYGLPLIQRLHFLEQEEGIIQQSAQPRALVLTGTRELVEQTSRMLKSIAHRPRARIRMAAGGMTPLQLRPQLGAPCEILIGNPPRLARLVEEGTLSLSDVRIVVVDEADTLLSPGQRADVERLLAAMPTAQVAYISATLPEPIRQYLLARPEKPILLLSSDAHSAPPQVKIENIHIKPDERMDTIHDVLTALPTSERGIVFLNRRETADAVGKDLQERGHDVVMLQGAMKPEDRRKAIHSFRDGKGRILVTTELSGRGIHLEDLRFVINGELPERTSDYIHRIGRVGRQGRPGKVINLVTTADNALLAEVKRLAQGGTLNTGEPLRVARDRERQIAARKARV